MIGRNGSRQVVVTVALMLPPGLYLTTHNPLTWISAAAVFAVGSTAWHLHLRRCRKDRSSAIEVLGIIQLTSAVPLVYLFGGANSLSHAMLLWLLVFAYYAGSLPYVRMRVRQVKMKERRSGSLMRIGVANLLYQMCMAALLIALILNNVMPAWVIIGFLPNIVKSIAHTFLPLKNLRMKRLGLAEMAYALAATIVLAVWAGGYVG
jgi:hypothetical protein